MSDDPIDLRREKQKRTFYEWAPENVKPENFVRAMNGMLARIDELCEERDQLRRELATLKRERDEAVEQVANGRTLFESEALFATRKICDQLRAQLEEAKRLLDATTGDAMCARAERDRYRVALERIADSSCKAHEHTRMAREALENRTQKSDEYTQERNRG